MILFANGCSHTAGAEIEYEQQGHCYDKAWPKYLADIFEFESFNLAESGASADRVVRTTLEFFLTEQTKPDYDPKNYFAILMWPGLYRTEIFDNNFKRWIPLVVGNDETYKKQLKAAQYQFYKAWVTTATPVPQTIHYYHNIMCLQNFFLVNKIKYLFWSASSTAPYASELSVSYKKQILNKRYPFLHDSDHCFTNLCHSNNQKISEYSKLSGFNSHYDAEAQKWFAEYLSHYIEENNLL